MIKIIFKKFYRISACPIQACIFPSITIIYNKETFSNFLCLFVGKLFGPGYYYIIIIKFYKRQSSTLTHQKGNKSMFLCCTSLHYEKRGIKTVNRPCLAQRYYREVTTIYIGALEKRKGATG